MTITVSLAQMDIITGQVDENLSRARSMIAEAARRGSDLVLLPELWSTGYDLRNAANHAAALDAGIFAETATLAARYKLHVAGSCLSIIGPNAFGNTLVCFGPTGERLGEYSKVHLYRLMDEDKYLTAGDRPTVIDLPWGAAGLAICYDLRFPELFRKYALAGARMVILPAEWPRPRLAHWRTLLRARAIENQMFVIACNRVGETPGDHFPGHSAIVDPWGKAIVEGAEGEELLTAEIDLEEVIRFRELIPVFEDRRPDLY
ncbi:MAG: carbon-nitrogen family hydrolase [Candidatus Promineifilaceae bacterium]